MQTRKPAPKEAPTKKEHPKPVRFSDWASI